MLDWPLVNNVERSETCRRPLVVGSHEAGNRDFDTHTQIARTPQLTVSLPGPDGGIDLSSALAYLGENGINNLLVEAGGDIAASFIKSGLLDELIVYQSPDIMGASARAMVNLPDILKMSEKIKFEYRDLRTIGRDLKIILQPLEKH